MNRKVCSFTGNRYVSNAKMLKNGLRNQLLELIKKGYRDFYNGGAIGFDTLCALMIIELKKEYEITLNMILPCENQAEKWNERQRYIYNYILSKADSKEYIQKEYSKDCMFARNRKLVDVCDVLIAYNVKGFGGTHYTVNYAKRTGKEVINIAEPEQMKFQL